MVEIDADRNVTTEKTHIVAQLKALRKKFLIAKTRRDFQQNLMNSLKTERDALVAMATQEEIDLSNKEA